MVFGVPFHSPLQRKSSSEGSESNTELTLSMFDKNMSDGIVGGIACGLLQEVCAQNGNGTAIHGKLQHHMTWPGDTASGFVGYVSDRSGKPESDDHKHYKSQKKIDVMEDIDAVPSNVQSAHQEAVLYMFEDNEAVIKMIIKGRSPTMRHVSRTHRVALDWLFDRINLDSKVQIKYIDTKNQLADILTKGNFTRDE